MDPEASLKPGCEICVDDLAWEPVAVLVAGVYLEVEVEALGKLEHTVEKITRVQEMPLRMILAMNVLSEESPERSG